MHLGNYLQIITNARGSFHGIHQIYLIGEATGRIGDPSGKSAERNLLEDEIIEKFSNSMTNQLTPVLKNLYGYIQRHHGGNFFLNFS